MNKWYSVQGKNSDVVLSSKIKLVRNIKGIPFPNRMTNEMRRAACKKIFASIQNSSFAGEFDLVELDKLDEIEKISLAEKGIISTQLAKSSQYSAVLISKDESISIMLCEENHICLTVREAGNDLTSVYSKANALDDIFIKSLNIAFDERLGFLTSNPMHLGTGMKASVLLHLPAICQKGMLGALRNMMGKLGFSVKSVFGDGCFYELANDISLGITEKSAIENLVGIIDQIEKQEKVCRREFLMSSDLEDKIFRAMGTLKMARQLNVKEFYSLISFARLGIALSLFDNNDSKSFHVIDSMLYTLGTATIMAGAENRLTQDEANRLRAQYIREKLV
ncbi:MAG: hypothetical protein NC397_10470 [Clostridium sp.]|nr:hypothetical protein [Clostridium sp.]